MKKYGFGIIGCGVISRWHADSIKSIENAELIGVFDNREESAVKFSEDYGCKVFKTMEDMFSSDDIDVVCICTPSGTHTPIAVKAAGYKKNVIVEKPMAITKEQISQLLSAVSENGVKMAVISQLRFTEPVKKIKDAIESGKLGKLLCGDVYMKYHRSPEYYSSSGWRGTWAMDGGGALMNQGIHGIDLLTYLMGPVDSVYAVSRTLDRDIEVEDAANVNVVYKNGAIGVIQGTTCITPGYPRRIEISGTKGTVVLEEDTITKWDIEGEEGELLSEKTRVESFRDPAAFDIANHKKQIEDIIFAIDEGRAPLVDENEGKRAVEIILAAYESSKTNKPVKLNQGELL